MFAGFHTDFRSEEEVLEFLFDTFLHESGKEILQHPFLGYDPSIAGRTREVKGLPGKDKLICLFC